MKYELKCNCGQCIKWETTFVPPCRLKCAACGTEYIYTDAYEKKFGYKEVVKPSTLQPYNIGLRDDVKEVKSMDIKIHRKPVDRKEKVNESVKRFLARQGIIIPQEADGRLINEIDRIYNSQKREEIESIEVPLEKILGILTEIPKAIISWETCKEIAKIVNSEVGQD